MTVAAKKSGRAQSGEADLYFERRGDGPPLLLITGGGGDAGFYAALDQLALAFTDAARWVPPSGRPVQPG